MSQYTVQLFITQRWNVLKKQKPSEKEVFALQFILLEGQFVTNLLKMKQANLLCELPKVKSSDMLVSTAFRLLWKLRNRQRSSLFHWPLLSSVTAIDSPIMTVCQDVSLQHKTLSCQSWLEHTYLLCGTLNTALARRDTGLWEYEFPATWGDTSWEGARRRAAPIKNSRMTRKTIATSGVGPEAQSLRVNTSPCFSSPSFSLLYCSAFLSLKENREGAPSPGATSFTARRPKGSGAKHKGCGHCHSPQSPATLKATFQSKTPPPRQRTGTGRSGPPWDTSRRRSHVSTSAENQRKVARTRRKPHVCQGLRVFLHSAVSFKMLIVLHQPYTHLYKWRAKLKNKPL